MNQPKILLGGSFIMVFCAGIAIGVLAKSADRPAHEPPWLADELSLAPEQQTEMRETWNSVRERTRDFPSQRRRQLAEDRDQAVGDLLTGDQPDRYKEILETYKREKEELIREWKAPFEEAMEKTRQILSEEQFQKFEELGKDRKDRGWNHTHSRNGTSEKEKEGVKAREE
jgi:Spy/CpxP family protein refolding chaperone